MSSGNSQNQFHEPMPPAWVRNDDAEVHAAGGHQHPDQREAHGDLVRHHLRRRAHGAEEGVLRVRRPAGDDDAVDAHRGERQQVQQARIGVATPPPSGDSGITAQAANAGTSAIMGARRNSSLLAFAGMTTSFISSLKHVGKRLAEPGQQAEQAHAVRAAAQLHPADDLALPQREHRDADDEHHRDDARSSPVERT